MKSPSKQFTPYEASILAHLAQNPNLGPAELKELLAQLSPEARKVADHIRSGREDRRREQAQEGRGDGARNPTLGGNDVTEIVLSVAR